MRKSPAGFSASGLPGHRNTGKRSGEHTSLSRGGFPSLWERPSGTGVSSADPPRLSRRYVSCPREEKRNLAGSILQPAVSEFDRIRLYRGRGPEQSGENRSSLPGASLPVPGGDIAAGNPFLPLAHPGGSGIPSQVPCFSFCARAPRAVSCRRRA